MVKLNTLPNGLTLIVEEIPHVKSASYSLLIPGGVVVDQDDSVGASLVLAELTSRGAGDLDSRKFSESLDSLGIRHSESGGYERFEYRGALLSDKLEEAMRHLSMMILEPTLRDEEVENIKKSFLQDIAALNDNPGRRAIIELNKGYFPSPYGRTSLGEKEGIENVNIEMLRSEWKSKYVPAGSVLSIAGNVRFEVVLQLVERYFSSWQGRAVEFPRFGELNSDSYQHIETESAQLQIALMYPSVRFGEPLYYAAKVANEILSGGMFGRLFIEVREKRGLCYSVMSRHSANRHAATVLAYAGTTPARAHETLEVMVKELQTLHGTISDEELKRARANILASLIIGEESSAARAASNAGDWWLGSRVRSLDEMKEQVQAVKIEDINRYLEMFPANSYALLTLGSRRLDNRQNGDVK